MSTLNDHGKVLVTGGTGFVGRHLIDCLIKDDSSFCEILQN